MRSVADALDVGGGDALVRALAELRPADIAELIERFPPARRARLTAALGDAISAEVVGHLSDRMRDEVVGSLSRARVAQLVAALDTDDALALVSDLGRSEQARVLALMAPHERARIEAGLSYPEDSAGRLMRRAFVAAHEGWSVGETIDHLRADAGLPEDFWELFVIDDAFRPVGTVRLSWLLRAPRDMALGDVMTREQTLFSCLAPVEDVALSFRKYSLISAAVVDADGRLAGVLTADEMVGVAEDAAAQDLLRLSGAGESGDVNEPVEQAFRARVRWLLANLVTALVASSVIGLFGDTIAGMVTLAALMPIVAGVGGNAGTQTLAVTIRGLATRQISARNAWPVVTRELNVALMNGATVATVIGLAVGMVLANFTLGAVIAAAMLCNIVVAGLAGVLVPLGLERAGADPAVASSVFVTMTTDTMGFLIFLGLASAFLVPG
jgi:magnesium transporter